MSLLKVNNKTMLVYKILPPLLRASYSTNDLNAVSDSTSFSRGEIYMAKNIKIAL
jgi:hypothetical protein